MSSNRSQDNRWRETANDTIPVPAERQDSIRKNICSFGMLLMSVLFACSIALNLFLSKELAVVHKELAVVHKELAILRKEHDVEKFKMDTELAKIQSDLESVRKENAGLLERVELLEKTNETLLKALAFC